MNQQIISNSKHTLANSCDELFVALDFQIKNLKGWSLRVDVSDYLLRVDKELVNIQFQDLLVDLEKLLSDVKEFNVIVTESALNSITEAELKNLIHKRKEFYSRFRIALSLYASTVTCLNWQSPAIKSSIGTRIGIEKSKVMSENM